MVFAIFSNMYINILEYNYNNMKIDNGYYEGTIIEDGVEKEYRYVYKLKLEKINGLRCKNVQVLLYVKKRDNQEIYEFGDYIYIKRKL